MENTKIFEEITEELRSIKENIAAEREALNAEKRALEQQKAEMEAPKAKDTVSYRDLYNAMEEKRAITLGGTGREGFVREIVKDAVRKHPLLDSFRYFYGKDSATNIPVLSPGPARPAKQVEGAKNIASDTQAALNVVSITPEAYVSILPVTDHTLKFSFSNIESEIPALFADSYSDTLYQLFVDTIYTAEAVGKKTAMAGAAPTLTELSNLALALKDYGQDAVILMNPTVYSALVATNGEEFNVYREELVRAKSIEGVRVELTSYAPSTAASGAPLVVGFNAKEFCVAIADQLNVEPIRQLGDLHTYFQASMYFGAKVVNANNVWGLTIA